MASFLVIMNLLNIVLGIFLISCANGDSTFDQYYEPQWGFNHLTLVNQGLEAQLLLDRSSGAGFRSKSNYCYGTFQIRVKIPDKVSEGVLTSFFLITQNIPGAHDEFDFEFVGTSGILQTNVFANDQGHREERIKLWFDPSKDFHTYAIVWSPQQIVFNVDNRAIRVFKKGATAYYPSKPMHVEASIWNPNWAGVIDWSKSPFIAHYQGFNINAQNCGQSSNSNSSYMKESWALSPTQQKEYEEIRRKYLIWSYCSDKSRNHPECTI